jgi:DNA-directed RNA polymerase I, II, and III subunit RPABC2
MSSYFDNDDEKSIKSNSDDGSVVSSDEESEIKVVGEGEDEGEEEELDVDIDEDDELDDNEELDDEDVDDDGQNGGDGETDLEEGEGEGDGEGEETEKKAKRTKKIPAKNVYKKPIDYIDDDDENDDNDGEQYLQKFDQSVNENYILNFHPESILQNYDEILSMTKVVRNSDGIIIDKLHRTIPYLTKYEKARILGQRAKQINSGAYPFVKVPENVIDGYIIAELELKQKRIPFIIRRPLPNGGSEYWKVQDLEDISF